MSIKDLERKALNRMTKAELIKELKYVRGNAQEAHRMRTAEVQNVREAMQNKISMVSKQYQEWKQLAEKYQTELRTADRDRDFFRRVLEKMSR